MIKVSPEKVFRAFSDATAYANWIPPYGFLGIVHQMDFKKGGSYKMSFRNFSTGHEHSFGGNFLEIEENKFIKHSDAFDDPNLPGNMATSIWINAVSCGTELKFFRKGFLL